MSESGNEYDENETDTQQDRDMSEEYDPDDDYDWNDDYDPDEDYDWKDAFDPDEDYDWKDDYDPDEDYDWNDEFDPNEDNDNDKKEENLDSEEDDNSDYSDNSFILPEVGDNREYNYNKGGIETIVIPNEESLEELSEDYFNHLPERESDPEIFPEENNPEDLAGEDIPEIPVPEDTFEFPQQESIEDLDQEPEFEDIPEWAQPEELAGDDIQEIQVPENTFEPVEPELEQINDQELKSDSEYEPEWFPTEELAGNDIPEILVPDDTFEFLESELESGNEEAQEELNAIEEEFDQEKSNDNVQEYLSEQPSDVLQKRNEILIIGNSFYSNHNDIDSFKDFKLKEEGKDQKKPERNLPPKTKRSQSNRKNSGSERNAFNKQRSSQETILVLKPETKEKETENRKKEELIKNDRDEKETQKESEEEAPEELKEKYKSETGKRATYASKTTKGFDEWLKIQKNSEAGKEKRQENKEKIELKEDWELLLEKWIKEADEKIIPKEIKKELLEKIRKYRRLRDLSRQLFYLLRKENLTEKETKEMETLIQQIKKMEPIREEIFTNLRAFKNYYNENIKWFEYRIQAEREKFTKFLAEKLEKLKENNDLETDTKNWKNLLKRALGSLKELNNDEKNLIEHILGKSDLTDNDIRNLSEILSKFETKVLVEIFGEPFYLHTKNYTRWGWDFYKNIKINILKDYFKKNKAEIADAAAFFKEIRKYVALIPNPCYCVRQAIENLDFFSVFLGLKPYYVRHKRKKSQRGKQLGLDIIAKIETTIKSFFNFWKSKELDDEVIKEFQKVEELILKVIKNYKNTHELKLYARGGNGIFEQHPDLIIDYFKKIDTLEKAYWLGWVFAEGYITIKRLKSGSKYYQFGVGLLQKDFILLRRFAEALGLDIINNSPKIERYITSKGEIHVLRRIKLINNEFCKYLISHGFIVGKRKSKNIRLPHFKRRELLLAFLLGYYDGDGTIRRSRITSASKKLLEDILNSPLLKIKVSKSNSIKYDPIKKKYKIIKGDKISLGADLLREMVNNYSKSLPRKRAYWENWVDKRIIGKNRPSPKKEILRQKLPKEILLKLMKKYTLKKIAYMHGVSYDTMLKYTKEIGVRSKRK